MTSSDHPSPESEREIVISRDFAAPRELVWDAMTDPRHVVKWWGPRGFTTQIEHMDVQVGGTWKHTMTGPDGTRYPNKSIFREVTRPERIVYTHGGGREDGQGASFVATWQFEALSADRTRVTIRMVFATSEARDFVVREYGAIEGGKQTLERLGEHLAYQRSEPFVIRREFAAPRDLVWRAWTEREHLLRWFGPKAFTMEHASQDLRPGGTFHYRLRSPEGAEVWGKFVYREIVPAEKLVWVSSFSDSAGGVTRHPFASDRWPLYMLVSVTLTEEAGRTIVTLTSLPLDADEEERRTYTATYPSLGQGWGGTLERLAERLEAMRQPA